MTATRDFHIGDILTVTTGRLVSPRRMEGVYDILNFMTGDQLFTHQLPRASHECEPHLLALHPQLTGITGDDIDPAAFDMDAWLADKVARFGETLPVSPVPVGGHRRIDPIQELADMVGSDRVVVASTESLPPDGEP